MRAMSVYSRKQQELRQGTEALQIIITCMCYVLHKRYRYTTKTLQSIVDEVYEMIIYADSTKETDWAQGLRFWREKMGLKV